MEGVTQQIRRIYSEESRDDLRTRNEAAVIRRGSGTESRERREDGEDDHPLKDDSKPVCGKAARP